MYADELLWPWTDALLRELPGVSLFDVHSHVGSHDPSGFSATVPRLLAALAPLGARAAVFPLAEPEGYARANDAVLAAAESHPELVAFCRVRPGDDALGEARRCLRAGARGVKLHPSGDEFSVDDDRLAGVFELAAADRVPVLIHAGPEGGPLAGVLPGLFDRFPELRVILAHDALTDLSWLAGRPERFPGLFFDTSWWSPADLLTLFARLPPGRIVYGSDLPYSTPIWGAHATLRCGRFAGLSPGQLRDVLGGTARRLLDRAELPPAGAPPGDPEPLDLMLERAYVYLCAGVETAKRGESGGQVPALVRHACRVDHGHPHGAVFASVLQLLDRYEHHAARCRSESPYAPGWDLLAAAAVVARTPGPALPVVDDI
jgi:hypothetical protein